MESENNDLAVVGEKSARTYRCDILVQESALQGRHNGQFAQ